MSEKIIPEHIDPFRFAEQRLRFDGIVPIAEMKRLIENVAATDGVATAQFEFGVDEQGLTFLKGHIEAQLTLICQRCMEPFIYGIISDFALGIVGTLEEANTLPEHYEPALAKERSLALRDLIEDEIILNLPIIPRHEPELCKVKLPLANVEWDQDKKESPFRVLESLKHKQK